MISQKQGNIKQAFTSARECINNGANAIIGPAYSSRTEHISPYLLGQRFVPAISYSATSPTLSDADAYPFFTRVVPPDDGVSVAAMQFVKAAGWKRIAVLYSDDSYGQGLHAACHTAAKNEFKEDELDWVSVSFNHLDMEDALLLIIIMVMQEDLDFLLNQIRKYIKWGIILKIFQK